MKKQTAVVLTFFYCAFVVIEGAFLILWVPQHLHIFTQMGMTEDKLPYPTKIAFLIIPVLPVLFAALTLYPAGYLIFMLKKAKEYSDIPSPLGLKYTIRLLILSLAALWIGCFMAFSLLLPLMSIQEALSRH